MKDKELFPKPVEEMTDEEIREVINKINVMRTERFLRMPPKKTPKEKIKKPRKPKKEMVAVEPSLKEEE